VQVVLLQRQLGEALAELQANRERLAEVHAIQVGVGGGVDVRVKAAPANIAGHGTKLFDASLK
jgi:hypothetical protein